MRNYAIPATYREPDDLTNRVTLAKLLKEAQEQHHAAEERLAFDHDWQDWYSAYIRARVYGNTIQEANNAADDDIRSDHAAELSAT